MGSRVDRFTTYKNKGPGVANRHCYRGNQVPKFRVTGVTELTGTTAGVG